MVVFETLAVLRREVARGTLSGDRAAAAVADLGDLDVDLVPAMPLRHRVWRLRTNLTTADALFVATAEATGEPLLTRDAGLVRASVAITDAVIEHLTP